MLMRPEVYHRSELEYDLVVGADTVVTQITTRTVAMARYQVDANL